MAAIRIDMDRLQVFQRGYLAVSTVGFILLWPMMAYNGTLMALLEAAWTGVFRDGRPLLTTYTGFRPFDFIISVLVAFFDDQINGSDNATWLLMLDLVATLQVASLWVFANVNRSGLKHWLLQSFVFWPLLWNLSGAAVVLPIYFYLLAPYTESIQPNPVISPARPAAVVAVPLLGAYIPAFYLLSAYSRTDYSTKHNTIAYFCFAPFLVGPLMSMISYPASVSQFRAHGNRTLYLVSALASGAIHVYCVATTLLADDKSMSFARVFVPRPSGVTAGSIDNIRNGASLFLQFDWIVVNVTCAMWVCFSMHLGQRRLSMKGWAASGLSSVLSTLLVGPGAAVSWALFSLEQQSLLVQYKNA